MASQVQPYCRVPLSVTYGVLITGWLLRHDISTVALILSLHHLAGPKRRLCNSSDRVILGTVFLSVAPYWVNSQHPLPTANLSPEQMQRVRQGVHNREWRQDSGRGSLSLAIQRWRSPPAAGGPAKSWSMEGNLSLAEYTVEIRRLFKGGREGPPLATTACRRLCLRP